MQGRLALDVVLLEARAVLQLLGGVEDPLVAQGDALFLLDLDLEGINGVRGLDVEGQRPPLGGLDEDLDVSLLRLVLGVRLARTGAGTGGARV